MNANIGKLNSGKCYVYLNGYRDEPFYGTEEECEAAILEYGVADPIPVFCDGVDLTTSKTGTKTGIPKANQVVKVLAKKIAHKPMQTFRYTLTSKEWYGGDQYGVIEAYNKTEARKLIAEAYRQDTPRNAKACGFVPWSAVKIVWEDE